MSPRGSQFEFAWIRCLPVLLFFLSQESLAVNGPYSSVHLGDYLALRKSPERFKLYEDASIDEHFVLIDEGQKQLRDLTLKILGNVDLESRFVFVGETGGSLFHYFHTLFREPPELPTTHRPPPRFIHLPLGTIEDSPSKEKISALERHLRKNKTHPQDIIGSGTHPWKTADSSSRLPTLVAFLDPKKNILRFLEVMDKIATSMGERAEFHDRLKVFLIGSSQRGYAPDNGASRFAHAITYFQISQELLDALETEPKTYQPFHSEALLDQTFYPLKRRTFLSQSSIQSPGHRLAFRVFEWALSEQASWQSQLCTQRLTKE